MANIKIKKTKPTMIAYVENKGDYGSIPFGEYYNRLFGWAKEKKVMKGFKCMGLFHDDPRTTIPADCRSDIAITVKDTAADDEKAGIKVKQLPALEVAVLKHKGPSEDFQKTYEEVSAWIRENGYHWNGPSMEVYTKKPKSVDGKTFIQCLVQVPVKKE